MGILVCYVALGSVFGNLPQVLNPHVGANAIAGLPAGALLYWLHNERAGQPLAYARGPKPQSLHDDRRETAGNIA